MKLISKKGFNLAVNDDFIYFIDLDEKDQDKFFKTNLETITEINKYEYILVKCGNPVKNLDPYAECIKLDNGEYISCLFQDSQIYLHDKNGNIIKEYNIGHFNTGFDQIYSIALDKNNNLWVVEPSDHYVGEFSLDTEKELFRVGGNFEKPEIFNYPEQARSFDNFIYIADMGNKRISKINIETKEISDHLNFEEPVWDYIQFKGKEIVKLGSGLYEI